jgi:hypothetical protein
MTDTVLESQRTPVEGEMASIPDKAFAAGQSGAVSFAELVRVHFEWERASRRQTPDEELEERFRAKLEEFQACEGTLLQAYWSRRRASAVALTLKPLGRFAAGGRLRRLVARFRPDAVKDGSVDPLTARDAIIRLHRATDWLAREAPIADLLHKCDALAICVSEVLRETSERIAMQRIFAVQSHVLGFVERTNGKATKKEIDALVKSQADELVEIAGYYARAGSQAARVVYFKGMMIGAFVSALLAGLLALVLWRGGWFEAPFVDDMESFFVSYAAGGVGAIVSVMSRMANGDKFDIDYEVGRPTRRLGAFRPFVGAIFGIAIFFLISSGLPQVQLPAGQEAFFYYGTVAFLAGFTERRTAVIFGGAEKSLEKSLAVAATDTPDDQGSEKTRDGDSRTAPGGGIRTRTTTTQTVVEEQSDSSW